MKPAKIRRRLGAGLESGRVVRVVERAMGVLGQPVGSFVCPSDLSTRELIRAAADQHPLTAFALGDEGDEQLMIGKLLKAGKKRIRHHFIHPDGTWAAGVDRWTYQQISAIHIGGRHIDSLALFGSPYPRMSQQRSRSPVDRVCDARRPWTE